MSGFTRAARFALLIATVLAFATPASAGPTVVLGWNANPSADNVTGYILHWSTVSRHTQEFTGFDQEQDVGNVTEWTLDLPDGTARCYFSVSAYNTDGLVSDYSTELGTVVVTAAATGGGTVSPVGAVVVETGGALDVVLTPNEGSEIEDIEIDGVSVGAASTYTLDSIDAPCDVLARFAPVPVPQEYTVSLSAGANGTVLPNGTISVTEGDNLTFTVTPDSGYQVTSVSINGADVGPVSAYTISSVVGAVTVHATFHAVATDPVDTDGDQIPDAWELLYFTGLDVNPEADSDGDGRSNYQEYLADTDPTVAELAPGLTPSVAEPISGATVVSLSPALVVDNPPNEDGVTLTYEFEIALDPTMTAPTAAASDVAEGTLGVTSWTPQGSINDQTRYYWRVRAVATAIASPWTPVNTFYVDTTANPTTTELLAAEYVSADADLLVEVLDPDSGLDGLGVDLVAATLPYDFVLTVSTVSHAPAPRGATRLAGKVVEFGPHGRPFDQQVTILLPYTDQTLEEAGVASAGNLDVFTYNTETLEWEPVAGVVTDYAGQRLLARVDHFSMYSLGTTDADSPVASPSADGGGGGGGCFISSLW